MVFYFRPIHLEAEMIIRMNKLMSKSVFRVALVPQMVLAKQDSVPRREASGLHGVTRETFDIGLIHVAIDLPNALHQECDDWACMRENESPTMLQVKTDHPSIDGPRWRVNRLCFFKNDRCFSHRWQSCSVFFCCRSCSNCARSASVMPMPVM